MCGLFRVELVDNLDDDMSRCHCRRKPTLTPVQKAQGQIVPVLAFFKTLPLLSSSLTVSKYDGKRVNDINEL
eukprot:2285360-Pleurochrysis_carterae.AAC.1